MLHASLPSRLDLGFSTAEDEELALNWLDGDDRAHLIVDRDLAIKWSNQAAKRELARRTGVVGRFGLLAATNPDHQGQLRQLLDRCRHQGMSNLCLVADDGIGHILLRARPLLAGNFGLSFWRCGGEFQPRYADLATAFDLTRSERTVLLRLADGFSADEIAGQLGVSIETTRSHIKNLYAKLNVKSRGEALSRIRAYQI